VLATALSLGAGLGGLAALLAVAAVAVAGPRTPQRG
jgi:hypothetical protein